MTKFLCFTIYAPLSSWGDIAVGEMRGSWDRPSRSAVLGLLAAALGIRREAQAEHDALDASYGVAVRLDVPGTPLVDYHTAQTVSASVVRKRAPRTRAELLAAVPSAEHETILSRRAYRQDAVSTVAVWARADAPWSLDALAAALRRPVFTLYAGRKANVLGLPLAPVVREADTLADAFRAHEHARTEALPPEVRRTIGPLWQRLRGRAGWGREVSHDPCDGFEPGVTPLRRETRRDAAAQRTRWQFAERTVLVGLLPEGAAAPTTGEGGT